MSYLTQNIHFNSNKTKNYIKTTIRMTALRTGIQSFVMQIGGFRRLDWREIVIIIVIHSFEYERLDRTNCTICLRFYSETTFVNIIEFNSSMDK